MPAHKKKVEELSSNPAAVKVRAWRAANPERSLVQKRRTSRIQGKKWRDWVNEQKNDICMDCKEMFPPECMDFDHVRGEKSFNLNGGRIVSMERALAERAKCDLVCANCHRIRTKKQMIKRWEKKHVPVL